MILQGKIAGTVIAIAGTGMVALGAALAWQTWQLKQCRSGAEDTRVELSAALAANAGNQATIAELERQRDANRETFAQAIAHMRDVAANRSVDYQEARAEARELEEALRNAIETDPTDCDTRPVAPDADRMLLDASDALPRDGSGPRPPDGN